MFLKKKRQKFKKSTADKWFSIYIRVRDIIEGSHGFCRCITCNTAHHWKEGDCGHFQTRDNPMTRFDERNSNFQCTACNRFKKGNQYKHGKVIDRIYGEGTADILEGLAGARGTKVHGEMALKDIAKEFRLKAKEMAKKKGVKL